MSSGLKPSVSPEMLPFAARLRKEKEITLSNTKRVKSWLDHFHSGKCTLTKGKKESEIKKVKEKKR